MKKWFESNKRAILFSTLGTLLPIAVGLLLWDQLPDIMTTHWGADGIADGTSSKWVAVFLLPLILAAVNLICFVLTSLDPKQAEQNKKAIQMIFWIMPALSMLASCGIYLAAMGKTLHLTVLLPILVGVLFIFIGNYMPKAKQNSFYGVKLIWTLRNEENWNKTHRFAGKLWVIGGLLLLPTSLLPLKWMVATFLVVLFVMILLPTLYSYRIYRAHKAQGISYDASNETEPNKTVKIISLVMVIVILGAVALVMVTGNITYTFEDDILRIDATFDSGLNLPYDIIDSVELRENFDFGLRVFGFSSARLFIGSFSSDELPEFTLYAYTGCKSAVLIQADGKCLAINAQTTEETQALYQTLLEKTAK